MKAEFINPFLKVMIDVLETMAQVKAEPQKPALKKDPKAIGDVTGIIEMSQEAHKGSLAINFSEETILKITSKILYEEMTTIDETVLEMVGEIANIVTGNVKGILSEKGYKFDMARPQMLSGKEHLIEHNSKATVIMVPFETEAGPFYIELCFEA